MKIVIAHQNTDFDALASMFGVRKLWPDHRLVLSSNISRPVSQYLALHRDWLTVDQPADIDPGEVTEVVVVDTRDRRRLSDFAEIVDGARKLTIYDHHPAGDHDIEGTTEIIEPVGSCATLLFERLEDEGIELDRQEATLMLMGIYADTGNLAFPSTTFRDLRAAAYLRKSGAMLPVVNRYLQREFSPDQQRLFVGLVEGMEIVDRRGLRLGWAARGTDDRVRGAAQVVERLLQMMGLDACFVALQQQGRDAVQVIGRSQTRHVDAGALARVFGGGGHPSAAAARIGEADVAEVGDRIRAHFEEMEIEPLQIADVMSSPVQVVDRETKLEVLETKLDQWGFSGVPVADDGQLVGIVSQRDVRAAADRGDWSVPAAGFMSHEVVVAEPSQSLDEALETMTEQDIGRLPVVDDGDIVGIVSRSDILRRLYGEEAPGLGD